MLARAVLCVVGDTITGGGVCYVLSKCTTASLNGEVIQSDDDKYDDDDYFSNSDCSKHEGWQVGYVLSVAFYSIGTLLSLQNKFWNDSTLGHVEVERLVQICKEFSGECEVNTGMFVEFNELTQRVEFRSMSGDASFQRDSSRCDLYAGCIE